MIEISISEMMDAGAHFGHQTRRWHPKMKPYLYETKAGIHIIDLSKTQEFTVSAVNKVEELASLGGEVLFVGTKRQAKGIIAEQARRANMPFVTHRWLGGMLTNFSTIRKSVDRLSELESKREKNEFTGYTKKELLGIDREISKLRQTLAGIQNMHKIPSAIFVIDPFLESIAVHEAQLLGLPVIAVTDTNCDPGKIDFMIPANDDAMRSVQYFALKIADACLAGREIFEKNALAQEQARKEEEQKEAKKPKSRAKVTQVQEKGKKGQAYVSKAEAFEGEKIESFSSQPEADVAENTDAAQADTTEPVAEAKVKKTASKTKTEEKETKPEAKEVKKAAKKEEEKADTPKKAVAKKKTAAPKEVKEETKKE